MGAALSLRNHSIVRKTRQFGRAKIRYEAYVKKIIAAVSDLVSQLRKRLLEPADPRQRRQEEKKRQKSIRRKLRGIEPTV